MDPAFINVVSRTKAKSIEKKKNTICGIYKVYKTREV